MRLSDKDMEQVDRVKDEFKLAGRPEAIRLMTRNTLNVLDSKNLSKERLESLTNLSGKEIHKKLDTMLKTKIRLHDELEDINKCTHNKINYTLFKIGDPVYLTLKHDNLVTTDHSSALKLIDNKLEGHISEIRIMEPKDKYSVYIKSLNTTFHDIDIEFIEDRNEIE